MSDTQLEPAPQVFLVLDKGDCLVVPEPPFSLEAQDQGWVARDSRRRKHLFPYEIFSWEDSCYLIVSKSSSPRTVAARETVFVFACSQPYALLAQSARALFSHRSKAFEPVTCALLLALAVANIFPPRVAVAPAVRLEAATLRTHHLLATLTSLRLADARPEESSPEKSPGTANPEKIPKEITSRRAEKRPKMHAPQKRLHSIDTLHGEERENARAARFFLPPSPGLAP